MRPHPLHSGNLISEGEAWPAQSRGHLGWCAVAAAVVAITTTALGLPAMAGAAQPHWYANGRLASNEPVKLWAGGAGGTPVLTFRSPVLGEIACAKALIAGVVATGADGGATMGGSGRANLSGCSDPQLQRNLEETYHLPISVSVTAELPFEDRGTPAEGEVCKVAGKRPSECPNGSERETVAVVQPAWEPPTIVRPHNNFWESTLASGTREDEKVVLVEIGIPAEGGGTCYPTSKRWTEVASGCVELNVIVPQLGIEDVLFGKLVPNILNGIKNGLSPSTLEMVGEADAVDKLQSNEGSLGEVTVDGMLRLTGGEYDQALIQAK